MRTIDTGQSGTASGMVLDRLREPEIARHERVKTLEQTYVQKMHIVEAWLVEEDEDAGQPKQIGKQT